MSEKGREQEKERDEGREGKRQMIDRNRQQRYSKKPVKRKIQNEKRVNKKQERKENKFKTGTYKTVIEAGKEGREGRREEKKKTQVG